MARIAALCAVLLFTCCCDGNVYSDGAGKSFNKHDGYVALGLGWSGLFSLNGRCDDSIHVPAWCVLHGEHSSCTLHRSARSTASHRFVRLTAQLVTSPCWYILLYLRPCVLLLHQGMRYGVVMPDASSYRLSSAVCNGLEHRGIESMHTDRCASSSASART